MRVILYRWARRLDARAEVWERTPGWAQMRLGVCLTPAGRATCAGRAARLRLAARVLRWAAGCGG